MGRCRYKFGRDPAWPLISWRERSRFRGYFPEDEQWVLRNLTTKEIVCADAVSVSPDRIYGPDLGGVGLGEVVLSRIGWSTSPSVSMEGPTNFSRGVWAGNAFDIITVSRHEKQTGGNEWTDVNDEVMQDMAQIWEAEYGPQWRNFLK
ncbi:hypothetical protein GGR57DRAFT_131822 [Xylariaceae sp. FL1272]|nr:hypothetical protein GGR57DRAFT_131822 [Xylariaceae sp. FL1272]